MIRFLSLAVFTLCLVPFQATVVAEDAARGLDIDPERITVSGISAGAQMAHQLHLAYSDLFNGGAMLAGGPFNCAAGNLATAMGRCVGAADPEFPLAQEVESIRSAAEAGRLAPLDGLADDPVWLFHGANDTAVAVGVSDLLAELYQQLIPGGSIVYVKDVEAGHSFPAKGQGTACEVMEAPYVADCGYDAAGRLLQHLYPGLQEPGSEVTAELTAVPLPGATEAGLSDTVYLFVPPGCAGGDQACALHLVLHGCAQSAVQLGTDFMLQSGYLPWAEANDIVLAFPQTVPSALNPLGCWDWWGYTGADYPYRDGKQMTVLADWIRNL
jgi:poly(3-hydroxybutyrate) depolymerase